jgi:ATP-dependent DNA helicase RecG
MSVLAAEVETLLAQGRGALVELFPERTPKRRLAETMAAMANGEGGSVLLGVSPRRGQMQGLKDADEVRDRVLQAALLCAPPLIIPLPQVVETRGHIQLMLIEIPRGLSRVYAVDGRYLTRDGMYNRSLTSQELRCLLVERGDTSFESREVQGATFDDLDAQKILRYLESVPALAGLSPQEALLKRGCLAEHNGIRPTVAGVLLFATDVERFARNEIIVVRYAGREMSDEFVREDIRDTLPEQVRRAEGAVLANLRTGARLSALQREDRLEYPAKAVREAIVNAVAHRDYSLRGDEIRIYVFSDRLEFYSPGRLPGHVTVDNIVQERFSRNQVIVQVLSDMGFVERLGYGIDRMIKLMAEEGLPAPEFREMANGFQVTLYGHGGDFLPEAGSRYRHWRLMGLNERQIAALEYLGEHERITNREYQELCADVHAETIRRDLADLVERGILLKIGRKRATYYIFK